MRTPSAFYSCVLDAKPKFVYQLWIWVTTLCDAAGVAPGDLHVSIVPRGEPLDEIETFLRSRGVRFTHVPPFGNGTLNNKLAQLDVAALREREYVALLDLDLAFLAPLGPWIGLADVCAKEVDVANPPIDVLAELFRRAGLVPLPPATMCTFTDAQTFVTNTNGGVWILRTAVLDRLRARWVHWLEWVQQWEQLLGPAMWHMTQISFCMAAWELQLDLVPLPKIANFPTHFARDWYSDVRDIPLVLHFHDRFGADGHLLPVGAPNIDRRLAEVNALLARTVRPPVFERALRAYRAEVERTA